ncbi:MAG: GNAT family N-acetyltransferase [Planctomycetales bacterium]|nr:GNAT family N-acetyltransferase [Planctomycetales bacterium]
MYIIRAAKTEDCATIADFNCRLAAETEDHELDRQTVTRGVERGLQHDDESQYFVAESPAGSVVGQLMVTREWSDWRDGWLWWIQSVYVQQDHRGNGIFRSLLDQVRTAAEQDPDVVGIRLYVENENQRAQDVYARLGFVDPNYRVLEMIFDD